MANEEHLAKLKEGVEAWNQWREAYPAIRPALSGADLTFADLRRARLDGADLSFADLSFAYLIGADLTGAHLTDATFTETDLHEATLIGADLTRATFTEATLTGATLVRATLIRADLTGADLTRARLTEATLIRATLIRADLTGATLTAAILVETNLERANLTGCRVYGVSTWNVNLTETNQMDLVITRRNEPMITVDNLEVAQFIYLLLHNEKIRGVIETITSKAVLILGRFTPERKAVLDAIREALRGRNLLPIMFDFTVPTSQTTLETVSTLAHMARFVIADLTDAKSILQELQVIVPNSPSVLVQPILLASQEEPGMFDFFRRFPWVLESYRYHSLDEVLASLDDKVITPAEKARERLGAMGR